jgi:hypothetical protein
MHKVILKGEDALHYAEAHHIETLQLALDDSGASIREVDLAAARNELDEHPERVRLEIETWINQSE